MPDLNAGFVDFYRFDGDVIPQSGGVNAAVATDVSFTGNGVISGGAEFGPTSRIEFPVVDNLENYTISLWVKPTDWNTYVPLVYSQPNNPIANTQIHGIFARGADNRAIQVWTSSVGNIEQHDFFGADVAWNSTNYPSGAWTHLLATVDGTNVRLYINGVEAAEGPKPQIAPNDAGFRADGPFRVGEMAGGFYSYNGEADDIGFWNRALDLTEIGLVYNAGAGWNPEPPVTFDITPQGELKTSPISVHTVHDGSINNTTGLGLPASYPWAVYVQDEFNNVIVGPQHQITDLDETDVFILPPGRYIEVGVCISINPGENNGQTNNDFLINRTPFFVVAAPGVKPKTKRENARTHIINPNLVGKKFPGPKGQTPLVVNAIEGDQPALATSLADMLTSFNPDWNVTGTTIENDSTSLTAGIIVARGDNYDKLMKFHAEQKQQFKSAGLVDPTRTAYFVAFYRVIDPASGVSYGRKELAAFSPNVSHQKKIRVPSNNCGHDDDDDEGENDLARFGLKFYGEGIFPAYTKEWFIVLCFGELPVAGPSVDGSYPYSFNSNRYVNLTNGWWQVKTGVRRVV